MEYKKCLEDLYGHALELYQTDKLALWGCYVGRLREGFLQRVVEIVSAFSLSEHLTHDASYLDRASSAAMGSIASLD